MHKFVEYITLPFRFGAHAAAAAGTFLIRLFLSFSLWYKLIVLNSVLGVLAVLVPVASFDILGITYAINNPLSITVIIIVLLFDLSIFFSGIFIMIFRVAVSIYYLVHFSLFFILGTITHAKEYAIAPGMAVNIVLMLLYIGFSVMHYLYHDN